MLTRNDVLKYLKAHPGATNRDLADHFNIRPNIMATRTKQLLNRGFVTRTEIGKTLTKSPVFGYVAVAQAEGKSAPERRKLQAHQTVVTPSSNVGERLDVPELSEMIQSLADTLAKQIASQVVVSLHTQLRSELAAVIPPALPAPRFDIQAIVGNAVEVQAPVTTVRKPKIGIVGVHVGSRQTIEEEFSSIFDIRFWTVEDGDSRLKSMAVSCELIYVMDYVGHKHTQLLTAKGAKWKKIHGGVSVLTNEMTSYFLENSK